MFDPARLFSSGLPSREWCQFPAEGFSQPACGAIFRAEQSPCCGVPLGGISTGCVDVDPRGVWGFSSIFNPSSDEMGGWDRRGPRKLPTLEPILGLASGGKTWVMATEEMIAGGEMPGAPTCWPPRCTARRYLNISLHR